MELLWLGLATLVFVAAAVFVRRSTRHAPFPPTQPTIYITKASIARRMLFEDADGSCNRPTTPFPLDFNAGKRSYSITTVPYGTLRCSLTADILHPTRVTLQEPLRREAVKSLITAVSAAAHGAGDVVVPRDSIHAAVYTLMVRLCFGDGIDARTVHAISRAQTDFNVTYASAKRAEASRLPRIVFWRRWLSFDAAFSRLSEVLVPLIVARRRQFEKEEESGGGAGFVPYVDSLLKLRVNDDDDGGEGRMLTEKEMAPLVWEFIGAGAESVASCVEWTLAHLISHPEIQDKLHRELAAAAGAEREEEGFVPEERLRSLPYLRAVILESLRMHPIVQFLLREVAGGGGATNRSTVVINAKDIGRDSKVWTDPDEFRPERFLPGGEGEGVGLVPGSKEIKMMPFGAGRRHCPGAGTGMLHISCFLAALVRDFEWAPPAPGDGGVDMAESDLFFVMMKTPLRAHATPRSSS